MRQYLTKRDGFWHYARRVPSDFQALDRRRIVRQSTKVPVASDPDGKRAGRAAQVINQAIEDYWRLLAEGQSADAHKRYAVARRRARKLGFSYAPASEVAEMPLGELLTRLETLVAGRLMDDAGAVSAVLGGEEPGKFLLSKLFDEYEVISRPGLQDLSPDQLRKWRNPKLRALNNLISVIGDKDLPKVTRDDALDFREWWAERVMEEGLNPDTANKDFGHVQRIVKIVSRHHRLKLDPVFVDMRIEGGSKRVRAAFDPAFVQIKILADDAFGALNEEARRVVYLIAETGLRPSEAVNLTSKTIVLDAEIPHVQVRPDGRRMKAGSSHRDIPLVGVALEVMRLHPDGFPRYRDKSASLSALVNDYMETHGMRPTPNHSLYSLRHTFKDRLREAQPAEELIDEIMGHENGKPKYGAGHGLRLKSRLLQQIAFKPPRTV